MFRKRAREPKPLQLSPDAFSDGQMGSKIWLCQELERAAPPIRKMTVLAGWYGLLPFLLLSRGRLPLDKVVLYDRDAKAVANSLRVNDHWRLRGQFTAECRDVNHLPAPAEPQIYVNTSCEHFPDRRWFDQVPAGSWVALQSTDMVHAQHVRRAKNLEEFRADFAPWARVAYAGQLDFSYTELKFSRFLVIGIKG